MRINLLMLRVCAVVVSIFFLFSCAPVSQSQNKNPPANNPGPEGEVLGALAGAVIAGLILGNAQDDSDSARKRTSQPRLTFQERLEKLRLGEVESRFQGVLLTCKGSSYFPQNGYELKSGARKKLTKLAELLLEYPRATFTVEVHTPTKGDYDFNRMLSEKQAIAFAAHLVRSGVREERVERLVGFGESKPIHRRDSQNWRIEMLIK